MLVHVRVLSVLLLVLRIYPTVRVLLQAEEVLPALSVRKKINILQAGAAIPLRQEHAAMIKPGAVGAKHAQAPVIVLLHNAGTQAQAVAKVNPVVYAAAQTVLAAERTAAAQADGPIRIHVPAKAGMRKILLGNAWRSVKAAAER